MQPHDQDNMACAVSGRRLCSAAHIVLTHIEMRRGYRRPSFRYASRESWERGRRRFNVPYTEFRFASVAVGRIQNVERMMKVSSEA
jgi:hypothetical protein